MNATRDLTLTERIRATYAELDPVRDDVLAAARAALTTIRKQTLTAEEGDCVRP